VGNLQTLTIEAAGLDSARALLACLEGFQAEIVKSEGGDYEVRVGVEGDRDINNALGAIDRHVTERADGPARVGLGGRHYLIAPAASVGALAR
jgi:hypothetical protein